MSARRPEDIAKLLLHRVACRWGRSEFPIGTDWDTSEDYDRIRFFTEVNRKDLPVDRQDDWDDAQVFALRQREDDPLLRDLVCGEWNNEDGSGILDADFPSIKHAYGQERTGRARHRVLLSGTNEFASESTGLYGITSQGGIVQYIKGQAFLEVFSDLQGGLQNPAEIEGSLRPSTMDSIEYCRTAIAEIQRIVANSMDWFQSHGYHYVTYMAHDKIPTQDVSGARERQEPVREGYTVRIAYAFFVGQWGEAEEEVVLAASFGGDVPSFGGVTPTF